MARENSPEKNLCGSGVPGKGWTNIILFQNTLHLSHNTPCTMVSEMYLSVGDKSQKHP